MIVSITAISNYGDKYTIEDEVQPFTTPEQHAEMVSSALALSGHEITNITIRQQSACPLDK